MIEFDWAQLSNIEFEDLCCDLLREEQFINVKRISGPGSGDGGRDIIAEEIVPLKAGYKLIYKYFIQCKNYFGSKKSIGPGMIRDYAINAETSGYDIFLMITSYDLSSGAKEQAEKINSDRARRVKVCYWTQSELISKLMPHSLLIDKYFKKQLEKTQLKEGEKIVQGYVDESGHIHVMGLIKYGEKKDYLPIRFLVDTGASVTTIMGDDVSRLGIDISQLESGEVFFASGKEVIHYLENVELLFQTTSGDMLSFKLEQVVVIPDFKTLGRGFGLIGMDILRNSTLTSGGYITFNSD